VKVGTKGLCWIVGIIALAVAGTFAQAAGRGQVAGPAKLPGVTVSGRVTEIYPGIAPPKNPPRVLLGLDPAKTGRLAPMLPAAVNADGTFVFDSVPPGSYRVMSEGPWLPITYIEVGSVPVRNVEVRFTTSIPIRFRWSTDDGSPIPTGPAGTFALTTSRPGESNSSWSSVDTARVEPYPFVPGDYYLFVRPSAGLYLKSLRAGRIDLRQGPLAIAPGSSGLEIEGIISRAAPTDVPLARLRGRLTGNHGGLEIGLADVTFPVSPARNPFMHTVAKPDGTFEFANLPPGRYEIDAPPARAVTDAINVAGKDVDVEVQMSEGQIVSGVVSHFSEVDGQRRPGSAGVFTLKFSEGPVARTKRITRVIFWDALPPGAYRVTIEGLDAGASVEALRAGSVDLLKESFVVPANRPPETITVLLRGAPF
jgi:hypothetical protein